MHPPSRKCSGSPSSGKASVRSADSLQRTNYDVTPGPAQRGASSLSNIILLVEAGSLNILIDWRPGEKPAGAAAGGSTPGPFPHGSTVLQMFGGTRLHLGAIGQINGRNRLPAGSSDRSECAVKNKTIAISGHWITPRARKYVRTCSGLSSMFLSVRVFANWYKISALQNKSIVQFMFSDYGSPIFILFFTRFLTHFYLTIAALFLEMVTLSQNTVWHNI